MLIISSMVQWIWGMRGKSINNHVFDIPNYLKTHTHTHNSVQSPQIDAVCPAPCSFITCLISCWALCLTLFTLPPSPSFLFPWFSFFSYHKFLLWLSDLSFPLVAQTCPVTRLISIASRLSIKGVISPQWPMPWQGWAPPPHSLPCPAELAPSAACMTGSCSAREARKPLRG